MSKSGSHRGESSQEATASSHSRAMFERHWESAGTQLASDPAEQRRIATLVELCPAVESLLDVGCGGGDVLRALVGKARLRIGCDSARAGLGRPESSASAACFVQAASEALPFSDRSIDLVSCCDVLEHLSEDQAAQAVRELARVARRYVLINVPVAEDLAWAMLRCARCGQGYHRDHHQRRYERNSVEKLLPSAAFSLVETRMTGGRVRRIAELPEWLGTAMQLGHTVDTRCPRCGKIPAPMSALQTQLRAGFFFAHNALTRPFATVLTRDTEIAVLFERRRGA